MDHENGNKEGQNYLMYRASDILKLLRTKEDRINVTKENSKEKNIIFNYRLIHSNGTSPHSLSREFLLVVK